MGSGAVDLSLWVDGFFFFAFFNMVNVLTIDTHRQELQRKYVLLCFFLFLCFLIFVLFLFVIVVTLIIVHWVLRCVFFYQ